MLYQNVLFFYESERLSNSRQVWKDFMRFPGENDFFFCAERKPEKPKKMYSTKLFTFSEVSLAFSKHRKKSRLRPGKRMKS